jgi:hypothetical protein
MKPKGYLRWSRGHVLTEKMSIKAAHRSAQYRGLLMETDCEEVTTVERVLSVDVIAEKGLVARFLGADGVAHHLQLPTGEAYCLVEMLTIAVPRLPAQH